MKESPLHPTNMEVKTWTTRGPLTDFDCFFLKKESYNNKVSNNDKHCHFDSCILLNKSPSLINYDHTPEIGPRAKNFIEPPSFHQFFKLAVQ